MENIKAPLLLISGGDDQIWDSAYMSDAIMQRRLATEYADKDQSIKYPDAGHVFSFPYQPTSIPWMVTPGAQMILNFGGNQNANAIAQEQAWEKMLVFLRQYV